MSSQEGTYMKNGKGKKRNEKYLGLSRTENKQKAHVKQQKCNSAISVMV